MSLELTVTIGQSVAKVLHEEVHLVVTTSTEQDFVDFVRSDHVDGYFVMMGLGHVVTVGNKSVLLGNVSIVRDGVFDGLDVTLLMGIEDEVNEIVGASELCCEDIKSHGGHDRLLLFRGVKLGKMEHVALMVLKVPIGWGM